MGHFYPPDDPYNYPIVYELPEMILIKNSHFISMDARWRWLRINTYILYLEMHMEKFFQTMNQIRLNNL